MSAIAAAAIIGGVGALGTGIAKGVSANKNKKARETAEMEREASANMQQFISTEAAKKQRDFLEGAYSESQEARDKMLDLQANMATEGISAQERQSFANQLQEQAAMAAAQTSTRRGGIGAVGQQTARLSDSYRQMLSQREAAKRGLMQNYLGASMQDAAMTQSEQEKLNRAEQAIYDPTLNRLADDIQLSQNEALYQEQLRQQNVAGMYESAGQLTNIGMSAASGGAFSGMGGGGAPAAGGGAPMASGITPQQMYNNTPGNSFL